MKYDLNDKTITIPDAEIEKLKTSLDISETEAIELYLADNGYIEDEAQAELTAKAKTAGAGLHATVGKAKRKPPVRKPDELKRKLIAAFAKSLDTDIEQIAAEDFNAEFAGVKVENIERMISFEVGGEKFELTLTKKRKPKE